MELLNSIPDDHSLFNLSKLNSVQRLLRFGKFRHAGVHGAVSFGDSVSI